MPFIVRISLTSRGEMILKVLMGFLSSLAQDESESVLNSVVLYQLAVWTGTGYGIGYSTQLYKLKKRWPGPSNSKPSLTEEHH